MTSIDTSRWGQFTIKNIFDIKRPNTRSQANYAEGDIPFVASGNFNNGVLKYLQPKESEKLDSGNCISVSPIDGSSFYQEKDFLGRGGAGSSIILLYNSNLNKYNGCFIATIIRSVCKKYMYSDMANKDVIGSELISLPVTDSGNPDWEYMEQYMRAIEKQVRIFIDKLTNIITGGGKHKQIIINTLKDFVIGDYFRAINTGNILSRDIVDGSGSTPFVTASGVNNGVAAYIDASNHDIIKGNCILIGGKTFTLTYQKNDFVSNDSHNIALYSKSASDEQVLLYIISVLNCSLKRKYNWGDAVTKDKLLAQTIPLPADANGKPDWNYMKSYMLSIKKRISSFPILH